MNQKPTVKEIQEEILILLSELDRVCRKNNIIIAWRNITRCS